MKKILQWLAVCVFAVLVFVPGIAQAQTTSTTATGNYNETLALLHTTLIAGFVFLATYLGAMFAARKG